MPAICSRCSAPLEPSANYCIACGHNVAEGIISDPVCPQCKTEYPEGTNFCTKDGSALVQRKEFVPRCEICGTIYNDDTNFCPLDGGPVSRLPSQYAGRMPVHGIISYPKGSLVNRFLACLLDGLIVLVFSIPAIVCLIAALAKDYNGGSSEAGGYYVLALLLYIIPIVYNLIKDGLGRGQSWGKRVLSLMVVNLETNMPCDKGKSAVRNLVSAVITAIPFVGWLIEPIMVLVTVDARKIGDRAANTQVIDVQYFT